MMTFRKFLTTLFSALILCSVLPLTAQQIGAVSPLTPEVKKADATATFRAGTIYSAEISSVKPDFEEESPYDIPAISNPAWVEVIVKLDNGRSISRFDYVLKGTNGSYPCFAVAEGNSPYSVNQDKWIIRKPSSLKYYRMLFPVQSSELTILPRPYETAITTMNLQLNYFKSNLAPLPLKIRARGDRKFSSVSRIPATGLYGLTEKQVDALR